MLPSQKYFEKYLAWPHVDKETAPSFSCYNKEVLKQTIAVSFLYESVVIFSKDQRKDNHWGRGWPFCLGQGICALTFKRQQKLQALASDSFTGFSTCTTNFPSRNSRSFPPHCESLSATLFCTFPFANP